MQWARLQIEQNSPLSPPKPSPPPPPLFLSYVPIWFLIFYHYLCCTLKLQGKNIKWISLEEVGYRPFKI
jgi:hypothetical protein